MASRAAEERREREGPSFREELRVWLCENQFQPLSIVQECLKVLNEEYLLSRPLPRGVVLPATPGPRNYRFLFRRNVASLLRWKKRRAEGDVEGFSDSLNRFIRETWWPDEASEALYSGPVAQGLAPELCSDAQASVLPIASRVVSTTTASGRSTETANRANRGVRVQQAGSRSALPNRDQPLDEMMDEGGRHRGGGQEEDDLQPTSSAAFDQRMVIPTGSRRSVRQRLEVGSSSHIVLEQSVIVVSPVQGREDTSIFQPGTSKRKKMGTVTTPNPSG